jgi:RNA polymerase sigma-70 factor, ECF subfamily
MSVGMGTVAVPRGATKLQRRRSPWRWLAALITQGEVRPDRRRDADAGDHAAGSGLPPGLDAFETFFQQHLSAVHGYLLRMTGDEQTAHDLSQEAFVRAWQHFARIQSYEAPLSWLLRVATNLALTDQRRRSLPVGAARPFAGDNDPARSDPTLRILELDAVEQALLALAPKQRVALVLREVYGLSCEEVGRALGVSRDAAKMLLFRGREGFRAGYDGGEGRR